MTNYDACVLNILIFGAFYENLSQEQLLNLGILIPKCA